MFGINEPEAVLVYRPVRKELNEQTGFQLPVEQGRREDADATLADLALTAYTRVADEGGFDLALYPAIGAWIARVEGALGVAV